MSKLIKKQYDRIYSFSKDKLYRSRWLFIEEGVRRGYNIERVHPRKLVFFVEKNGNGFIYNTLPGAVTARIRFPYIVNKIFQKKIMKAGGISVAESFAVIRNMREFEKSTITFPCVIKPAIGTRSKNVFIDINTFSTAEKAVQEIVNAKSAVIIEQMYVGTEYRILAVNGRVISCVQRRPASVVGDGVHTIEELINIKNADPMRGLRNSITHTLHHIVVDESVRSKLRKEDLMLESIIDKDKVVFVTTKINTSVGADLVDYTNKINDGFVRLCERFVQKHDFFMVGFDVIAEDITKSPNEQKYIFNELNEQPFFDISEKCNIGDGVLVASIMWDEIEKSNIMTEKFLIF